jgi:OOP family OmpA-OmpF porin
MGHSRRPIAALAMAVLTSAGGATAQVLPSIDARTWRPSADPRASLASEPVVTPGPWNWNVGVWTHYSQDPLVLRDPATGSVASRPVEHLAGADLVAGIGIGSRVAVGADVPAFVWQDGTSPLPAGVVGPGSLPASGLGDVSLLGKVAILSNDRDGLRLGFGLAALAGVSLPTGNRSSFLGDGQVTANLRLLAEYGLGVGALRAALGYAARPESRQWPQGALAGATIGNAIPWSIGLTLQPRAIWQAVDSGDRQIWEIAAHGALPGGPVAPFGVSGSGSSLLSPVMLALDDRIALGQRRDTYVLIGADIGLDDAVGTPIIRAVVALGWAPRTHDSDADGVPDDLDECPDLPEDRDGIQDTDGCPEDDADGDGVLDPVDACPLAAGVPSADPKKNGCAEGDRK